MSDSCENASSCDCNPTFAITPPHLPPPPIIYWNTQQCATASCPSGLSGASVTICTPANTYSSEIRQSLADQAAYDAALAQATASLVCGIAAQLSGLLFLMPNLNNANPCTCADPVDQTVTAQGNAGQTYSVLLRVRGIVELKPYSAYGLAGTQVGTYGFQCTNPTHAIPAVPARNDNEYCIVVSDPAATIMLNSSIGPSAPIASSPMDYQLTIQVKTGATVTLKARSMDSLQWKNVANTIINSAPPAMLFAEPYGGQAIQIDVLSIF